MPSTKYKAVTGATGGWCISVRITDKNMNIHELLNDFCKTEIRINLFAYKFITVFTEYKAEIVLFCIDAVTKGN